MRKSLSMRITEMMRDEDKSLPLEERNENIHRATGMQLALIEQIRRNTVIRKRPEF